MGIKNKQQWFLLLVGDIVVFLLSLWITLVLRYFEMPTKEFWIANLMPFSFIFLASIIVFFIAGLYEKPKQSLNIRLPVTILNAQIANAIIAALFFYFITFFGVNPKTILLIYIAVSTLLIFIWRFFGRSFFELGSKRKIILIGEKGEVEEIQHELVHNKRLGMEVVEAIDIDLINEDQLVKILQDSANSDIHAVVADSKREKVANALSKHYDFVLSNIVLLDIHDLYESIFDKVNMNSIDYSWLVQLNSRSLRLYDIVKRITDLIISVPLALITFPFFPLVALIIKMEDRGPAFITQERVGKDGRRINMYKFRSMTSSDNGVWLKDSQNTNRVTKVGYFLRKSRIDELPQLINVIRGDISLIGPRPDIIGLGEKLMSEIPYYMTRYSVLPGLSGWAQIQQAPPQTVDETKLRFYYDLFYVKHRSIFLDFKIALHTIKTLLARTGM